MKKKRLSKLIIALSVIVVLVILSSTVFTLKNVELCFYASDNSLIEDLGAELKHFTEEDTQDIIDSGEFSFGDNIFFIQRQLNIEKIEAKYPYIKIIGISATFPDGFKIKARERDALYRTPLSSGGFAILDEDLKVLEVVDSHSSVNKYDTILINNLNLDTISAGSFVSGGADVDLLKDLGNEIFANNFSRELAIHDIEEIRIVSASLTDNPALKTNNIIIKTRHKCVDDKTIAGVTIEIENAKINFETKINKAFSIYSKYRKDGDVRSQAGTIKVYEDLVASYSEIQIYSE